MFKGNKSNEQPNEMSNKLNRFVEGTQITGDITSEGNIRIDGELKGNLTTTGKLVIGKNGKVEGNIICSNADIEGAIIGTIKVDGLLVIKNTANLTGDISTHKIKIDEEAVFNGTVNMNPETHQKFNEQINLEEDAEIVY
jgi:cytoskeletal protein CcmA (bactofilin family)